MNLALNLQLKCEVMNVVLVNPYVMVRIGEVDTPHPIVSRGISPHRGERLISNRVFPAMYVNVLQIKY